MPQCVEVLWLFYKNLQNVREKLCQFTQLFRYNTALIELDLKID